MDSETLVYWVVLEKAPVGIREVQRLAGFSSPSTALYHLDKLKSRGLICKNQEGNYCPTSYVKIGMLRWYMLVGRHLIPKSLVYAILLSVVELFVMYFSSFRLEILLTLMPALIAAFIFWQEAYDLIAYKKRLFKRCSNSRT